MDRWSKERAWEWANSRPWIRGFNYVCSDCVNRMEQWQSYEHEKKIPVMEAEFALAQEWGFNAIRSVLPFEPWYYEHDAFMKIFEDFLTLAHKYGLSVMPVFGNDCTVPKEMYTAPKFGPQPVDLGYHGGMKRSPHAGAAGAGYSLLDEPELAKAWTNMVDELVGKYAHDERINIWDIFNEPGNGRRGSMSMPHMINFFEAARKHSPVQPLTAGPWTVTRTNTLPEIQQLAMDLSDVISYHDYSGYENSIGIISRLKKEGRPLFNTEWLHRVQNNKVQTHLPLYWLEGVGIYNWGFVVGKSQNHEPWEAIWKRYYSGERTDYDFTQWQHELVRPNMRPYDPREYDLFVKYAKMADEEFKAKKV